MRERFALVLQIPASLVACVRPLQNIYNVRRPQNRHSSLGRVRSVTAMSADGTCLEHRPYIAHLEHCPHLSTHCLKHCPYI
jgi:hypothetical protein